MQWRLIAKAFTNKEMRNKTLAVIAMLVVYRFMAHIPVPIGDANQASQIVKNIYESQSTNQSDFLSFINVLSGGALQNFSIMLIGLGAYINSSIIIQLLTKAIPKLEALNQEGEFGRRKINQYTRILALPLSIVQSIGALYLIRTTAEQFGGLGDVLNNASILQWGVMVVALSTAAMILMWLGELITEKGVGNGISLLITVSIMSSLPATLTTLVNSIIDKKDGLTIYNYKLPIDKDGLIISLIIIAITIIVTLFVVYLNEAQRKLKISYAKRVQGNRAYGDVSTTLPIKLITAGVVPIIFAVAFLAVPQFAGELLKSNSNANWAKFGTELSTIFANPTAVTFSAGGWKPYIYPVVYSLLIFAFTYFYTSITFDSKEISENLQKQGGFITDIRPGKQTEKYLSKVVNRLTLFGALSLTILALMPIIGQVILKTSSNIAIGGTGILIIVSVSLETLRQIESKALMVTYDDYTIDISNKQPKRKLNKLFTRNRKV